MDTEQHVIKGKLVERKTWQEFQDSKMLWWINRILHTFGWAIVLEFSDTGIFETAYPAKVAFRGFSTELETEGFNAIDKLFKEDNV